MVTCRSCKDGCIMGTKSVIIGSGLGLTNELFVYVHPIPALSVHSTAVHSGCAAIYSGFESNAIILITNPFASIMAYV